MKRNSLLNFINLRLLFVFFLLCKIQPLFAEDIPEPFSATSPVEDIAIINLFLNDHPLCDGIISYIAFEHLLVPLEELSQLLEFPIEVDIEKKQAQGWFIRSENTLFLDFSSKTITVSGETQELHSNQIYFIDNDCYVDTFSLEEWMPLTFNYNSYTQSLFITSKEPLPAELSLIREKKRHLNLTLENLDFEISNSYSEPYKFLSSPLINLQINTQHRNSNASPLTNNYNIFSNHDFLFMHHQMTASGNDSTPLSHIQSTFSRSDPYGRILPPLNLTNISVGDIFTPSIPLTCKNSKGRGFSFSNFPEGYQVEFDRTTVRGRYQQGWEVELYRNDLLIDFQRIQEDGIYDFEDIQLVSGLNTLLLKFYGPFGQCQEETHRYFLSNELIRKGEYHYAVSYNQDETNLINLDYFDFSYNNDNPDFDSDPDPEEKAKKGRFITHGEVGLGNYTSLVGRYANFWLDEENHSNYLSLGIKKNIGRFYLYNDLTHQLNKGAWATAIGLQTQYKKHSVTLLHEQFFSGFYSERTDSIIDPLSGNSSIRVNSFLYPPFTKSGIQFRNEISYKYFNSGDFNASISSGNSFSCFKNYYFYNTIKYSLSKDSFSQGLQHDSSGTTTCNFTNWKKANLRGEANYLFYPKTSISSLGLTADWHLWPSYDISTILSHNFQGGKTSEISVNCARTLKQLLLGLRGNITSQGDISIGLSLSSNFSYLPEKKRFYIQSSSSSKGLVSAHVYLDGEGEERPPLSEVKLLIDEILFPQPTDDSGYLLIDNLPTNKTIRIRVDKRSLLDPFKIPAIEEFEIVTRAGVPVNLLIPIIEIGEVEGTVYVKKDGALIEASNVVIQLLDKQSLEVVSEEKSSFDGFFLFEEIPVDSYLIQVSPKQLEKMNAVEIEPQELTLTTKNPVENIEFIIEYKKTNDRPLASDTN